MNFLKTAGWTMCSKTTDFTFKN